MTVYGAELGSGPEVNMPAEHQRIHEVSGVGFHVTTRRPDGAGMPIAFLHGYMSNAAIWSPLAACLDVDAPMLFIDLPGSGRSPSLRRVSDLSATALAGRLCELLVRLDVDRCHLVGAQMGGSLAAYMLALDARLFDKAVIMAAGALGEAPTNMTFYRLLASRSCGWLIRRIMSRSDFLTRWRRAHGAGYDPSAEWLSEIVSQFRDRGTEMTRLALAVRTSYGEQFDDLAGHLDNIDNKTLLIWGADDRLVPLSTGQRFRALLRDSELVVLPGVGDFPHEERPMEVANLIKRFLAQEARSSLDARAANATRQDDHLGTPSVPRA